MAHNQRVVHHYSGVRFDRDTGGWKLETTFVDDRGTSGWVDVDDLPRSPAIDDFFLQFNDLYEEMTAGDKKRENEVASQASYHESEFDGFIDHTPDGELEIFESENEKALRKAEKELKKQKKEKRKRKLLDELRAESKLKRRMLVLESSDEE
ncbi:hypothetical protein AAVH_21744 [Aphelenchoides avenae]|nr:hypothetical protein AAVH_21744 [Aphelenchus avenae]